MSIGLVTSGITAIAGLSSSFSAVYGTIEATKLAKEQQKLNERYTLAQIGIQRDLADSQNNIFLVQEEGIRKNQEIDLKVRQAQADLSIKRIKDESRVNKTRESQNIEKAVYVIGTLAIFLSIYKVFSGDKNGR